MYAYDPLEPASKDFFLVKTIILCVFIVFIGDYLSKSVNESFHRRNVEICSFGCYALPLENTTLLDMCLDACLTRFFPEPAKSYRC